MSHQPFDIRVKYFAIWHSSLASQDRTRGRRRETAPGTNTEASLCCVGLVVVVVVVAVRSGWKKWMLEGTREESHAQTK